MKQFYTYLHCKPNGEPFYVGKGTGKRCYEFFKSRRSEHHLNIVRKYGRENIMIFVFPCDSEKQAFNDEIQQISQLRSEGFNLVNHTDGGEGHSGKGHPPWNKGLKGVCVAWNKGLKGAQTAWNKDICGEKSHSFGNQSRKGQRQSEEEKQKKSESLKMRYAQMTPERRLEINKKISLANKGQVPWVKGKKNSPETIAKRKVSTRITNISTGRWKS